MIHLLEAAASPTEAADPAADRVTAGAPRALNQTAYESPDGRVFVGTWSCSPGRWRVEYDETEYCRVLEGVGALIDEQGVVVALKAGDEFVIPAGFRGEWEVIDHIVKRYVIVL